MFVRIAAWNLNHRTKPKPISREVADAVLALRADILVLTEYVDGAHQEEFKEALRGGGYSSIVSSPRCDGQNQVLLVSRVALVDQDLLPVPGYTEAAMANWVHRRAPDLRLEIVGMRVPAYKTRRDQRGYWSQVETILQAARDRPVLMIGDFNCDPATDSAPGSVVVNRLRQVGYGFSNPEGACSYFGPTGAQTRIDHAISTPLVDIRDAIYRAGIGQHRFGGGKGAHSDHSVLEVTCSRNI